jgi:hypothetical protein
MSLSFESCIYTGDICGFHRSRRGYTGVDRGRLGEIMSDVATTAPPIAARSNGKVYWIAAGLTFLFVIIGSLVISKDTGLAVFLFDHSSKSFFSPIYPVTIQNGLYLMFSLGVADLWVRYQAANREQT